MVRTLTPSPVSGSEELKGSPDGCRLDYGRLVMVAPRSDPAWVAWLGWPIFVAFCWVGMQLLIEWSDGVWTAASAGLVCGALMCAWAEWWTPRRRL